MNGAVFRTHYGHKYRLMEMIGQLEGQRIVATRSSEAKPKRQEV